MTTPAIPATSKQLAYLRKLAADAGVDLKAHLVAEGIGDPSWPSGALVARVPSKTEASRLIDGFLAASGRPARSSYGRRGNNLRYAGRTSSGAYVKAYSSSRYGRCEDAPCCGCCS